MGAGSAKGLHPSNNDDADRLSSASSNRWHSGDNSDSEDSDKKSHKDHKNHDKNHDRKHIKRTVNAEVSSSAEPNHTEASLPVPPGQVHPDTDSSDGKEQTDNSEQEEKKEEVKKKSFFKFSRKKEEHDKAQEEEAEDSDDEKKRKESKRSNKKEGEKGGFKLFGWRNKKNEEKENELDKDIDDLEKTFDSLGIVGKNMWNEDKSHPQKKTADDLELLEPMRKTKNVRARGTRGMNGMVAGRHDLNGLKHVGGGVVGGGGGGGSSGSRRTFRYSWETEKDNTRSVRHEDDEWEYKAVVIEGFDIDKFRQANQRDGIFDSTSLPNAVGDDNFDGMGIKSPLRYDPTEQQILASIERDFTMN